MKSYDRYWYTDVNFYLSGLLLHFCCSLVSCSNVHRLSPGVPVTLASCPKLVSTFTVRMDQGGLVPVLRLLACCPCSTVTLAVRLQHPFLLLGFLARMDAEPHPVHFLSLLWVEFCPPKDMLKS